MKKSIICMLCLALLTASLTSCGNNNDDTEIKGEITTDSSQISETPEKSTDVQDSYKDEPNMLVNTVNQGIYQIEEKLQCEQAPEISVNNGMAILCYPENEGEHISVIRIANGCKQGELTLMTLPVASGITDNGFYTYDGVDKVQFYDYKCNKTFVVTLKNKNGYNLSVSPDEKYILHSDETGLTLLYDIENTKYIRVSKDIYATDILCYDGTGFYANNPDGDTFRIGTNGQILNTNRRQNSKLIGNRFIETTNDGYVLNSPMSSTYNVIYGDVESEYVIGACNNYMVSQLNDGQLKVYDLIDIKSTDDFDAGEIMTASMDESGDTIFITKDNNQFIINTMIPDELAFANELSKGTSYTFAEPYKEYFADVNPQSTEVTKLLNEIYETYNVRVFFEVNKDREDELLFHSCTPYTGNQLELLKALKQFMSLSPNDIYRQTTKSQNEVWVMFGDDLKEDYNEQSDVVGVAFRFGDNPIIVVEKAADVETMMNYYSHEFIHTLDYAVDSNRLEQWDTLSPENSFFGSYIYPMEADMYTFGRDGANAFFTDAYARTFPEEDRARIGQDIYESYVSGERLGEFSSEHIKEKAKKLARMYRDYYPCLSEKPAGMWYLDMYIN